jgi:ATP-binding cassette subfamily B (MDR/TAP) protein 1
MFAVTSLGRLFGPIIQMVRAASASTEIFLALDAEFPDMSGLKDPDVHVQEDIIFRDVSFIYPTRPDTVVLDKLNLRFETGKTTAIVGPSGSGKSTIVGLLERWYEPSGKTIKVTNLPTPEKSQKDDEKIEEKGEKAEKKAEEMVEEKSEEKSSIVEGSLTSESQGGIFIGDINLKDIDAKWWRSNVGLVQQEPFLFNDSIINNVAHGLCGTKLEKLADDEKLALVQNACKEAFADEFINRLPLVCLVLCNFRFGLIFTENIEIRNDGW